MAETRQVTYKNMPATLTINSDYTWTISGTNVNEAGKGVMSLMKLVGDRDLSMTPPKPDPNAAAAAAGRRRKTRKSRHRRRRMGGAEIVDASGEVLKLEAECPPGQTWTAVTEAYSTKTGPSGGLMADFSNPVKDPTRDGRPLGLCGVRPPDAASAPPASAGRRRRSRHTRRVR